MICATNFPESLDKAPSAFVGRNLGHPNLRLLFGRFFGRFLEQDVLVWLVSTVIYCGFKFLFVFSGDFYVGSY